MRITLSFLFFCILFSSASNGYSQEFTIKSRTASIKEVCKEIEKNSDYIFVFSDNSEKALGKKVNVEAHSKNVTEILDAVLSETGLTYKILDKQIVVYKSIEKAEYLTAKMVNNNEQTVQQRERRITGKVFDVKGETLIGVNVIEKGTTNGVITDANGIYSISLTTDNPILKFTYIGFKEKEVPVGKQDIMDVVLEEDVSELEEVVVVGYGQQKKITATGSQATLKNIDLKTPSASLSTVLAGRLAGIIAVQRSGEPGKDAADIWIRGISTSNNSTPLILVDGIERNFNDIDPEDIESITTLKDASATAVYGVRGANGVIIIQTKPGIVGKPKINVDYYEGINMFTMVPEMADGPTFMRLANEALANDEKMPLYSEDEISKTASGEDPLLYPNVNWMKEIFRKTAPFRRINANARGGSPNANYYVSVSFYDEDGLINTNDYEKYSSKTNYKRYNFTTNLNLRVTPSTTADIGAQGYLGDGNYPSLDSHQIFIEAMTDTPINYPKMFYIGGVEYVPGKSALGGYENPYADATKRGYRKVFRNQIYSNIRLTQDLSMITQGLKFSGMFAFDVLSVRTASYQKRESTYYFQDLEYPYDENGDPILTRTYVGTDVLSFARDFSGSRKDYLEASLTYDRSFGNHQVGGLILYTQESIFYNHASDIIGSIPYRMQGAAGRATYSWKDRYLAEFNIGYNGSENFPPETRFGTFPAFSVGWIASGEPFWKGLENVIPFFKIRYSNGKVGNSSVGNRRFMYLDQLAYGTDNSYTFGNSWQSGVSTINHATPLKWEIAHKHNLGFDIRLLKDRELSLTFDLFKEKRSDILRLRETIPNFLGYSSIPYGNVGIINNKGLDGALEYNKRFGKDLMVTIRGNFTYNKNEWVEDDMPEQRYPWMNRRGNGLFAHKCYIADGLITQAEIDAMTLWNNFSEEEKKLNPKPFPTPPVGGNLGVKAGDIKYKDLNEDGKIDDYDSKYIGNGGIPQLVYGFGFNVSFKNVSLGLLFQGASKMDRIVGGTSIFPFMGSGAINMQTKMLNDRWKEDDPHQNVFYPRLSYSSETVHNQNNYLGSTWWLKEIGFLRLKTLQLRYNLPNSLVQRFGLSNINLYLMGTNLFTFSNFKLWDPELNTNTGVTYPNTSNYSLGINFSF